MSGPCFLPDVKPEDLDKALTKERAIGIYRYTRDNYLYNGVSFEQAMTNVAEDLKIPRDLVARAFAKDKVIKRASMEAYAKQQAVYKANQKAKVHVATIDETKAYKMLVGALSMPRRILTLGHGPVFPVTHALDLAGSEWGHYYKSMKNSWKFASTGQHAAAMDYLRNDDPAMYMTARRGGLEIDPDKGPSGILIGGIEGGGGKITAAMQKVPGLRQVSELGGWSRRAWDALKITRYELFKERWNDLAPELQTREMAKQLSSQINHSTGVMSTGEWGFGQAISRGMFAPQLTASKIAKTFVDPYKTGATFLKRDLGLPTTPEERYIATLRERKAAMAIRRYIALLAANQGLLAATGSKDRINYIDPTQTDWLRPKAFGHMLNTRGSMELVRNVGQMLAITQASRSQLKGATRTAAERDAVAKYAQYKMAPNIQLGIELATKEDVFGRPLPWSDLKGTPSHPKYTYPEYIIGKGPIYLGGATREVYDSLRKEGLSAIDSTKIIRALMNNPEILGEAAAVGATEFVGGGISRIPQQRPTGGSNQPDFGGAAGNKPQF